jgi:hypothetical protein
VELIELKRACAYAWHTTFAAGWDWILETEYPFIR